MPPAPPGRVGEARLARGAVQALPLAATSDEALARAAAAGHPGAAAVVWTRFAPLVRRLLRRTLGPGDEVEDRVQDTFLRFFRSAGELRDPALLQSYIVGIAMRVAREELRRRRLRRWLQLTPTGVLPEAAWSGVDAGARAAVARLYTLLDGVDDRARMLFVLRHIEGLELTEIAAAMDTSLATVKRHLARASQRILAAAQRDPELAAYLEAPGGESAARLGGGA
ncbi:RNA polymerase sigma factor RpoE [Chondromyces apiculatus DSM 436]|uniref:RNA polymerase sigma factor RpoE n=1 Tax=Chondromyces apiculatus DSM 436 TaxID=1192034 RepID=A0A017T6J2_9BACT|nr:RNA polymerase sigma factor RpoE [Chondromyces apiculatus DSM 436]